MITLAHVLVGGATAVAVAQVTPNPIVITVVAAASHFVMDAIPHLDVPPAAPRTQEGNIVYTPAIWTQVFLDVLISGILVFALWLYGYGFPDLSPFILGAFGGFLPDLIDNVPFWNKPLRKLPGFKQFHAFHEQIHHFWEKSYPMHKYYVLGILTQLVAIGGSYWYLLQH